MLLPVLALLVASCDQDAADLLYRQAKFTEAAYSYRSLLGKCPPSADLLSGLGRSFLALGRPYEAVPYLVKAAELKPGSTELRRTLAHAFIDAGRVQEADAILQALCNSDPKDTEASYLEGMLMYRNGYYQRALEFLEKSLALRGDNVPAQQMLAVALVRVGRTAEGQVACKRLLDSPSAAPDLDVTITYAESFYEDGRTREALVYADRAVQHWPRNSIAWFWRARLLLDLGRNEDALKDAQQSVLLAPQLPFGHTVLLLIYRKLGRTEDAGREAEWLRQNNSQGVARGRR
jgi:tetratricopeptide (TPR) repeat protein